MFTGFLSTERSSKILCEAEEKTKKKIKKQVVSDLETALLRHSAGTGCLTKIQTDAESFKKIIVQSK